MSMRKRLILVFVVAAAVVLWAVHHFYPNWRHLREPNDLPVVASASVYSWDEAVEKVKADRGELAGGAIVVPPELRHYSDRHWFLATQVAEVEKYRVPTCQDFLDLAAMIQQGQLVAVPAVTDTYVLYGVGEKADDSAFTAYRDDHSIELYDGTQLNDAYRRLGEAQVNLRAEIASLSRSAPREKRERHKKSENQKQVTLREQELSSIEEQKALLDQFYGQTESRNKLFREYESLQQLARDFGGRSYNLSDPAERKELKMRLLRSIRPEALRVLQEIASAYHKQFDRPLPVSSLVRPEQYQRLLYRANRNAVLIETPPHSTGLAFDIDYRYMSGAEQTFLMAELARLKNESRIEVIRERNANYHIFAFVNGTRPSDDLITASLDKAQAPVAEAEAHHVSAKPSKVKSKSQKGKGKTGKSKTRRRH
jgi:hypothetical protein